MNSYEYYLLVEKIWLHCQKVNVKLEQRHSPPKSQDVCMMGGTNLALTTQTPVKIWGAISLLALTKLWKGPLTSHLSSTLEFIGYSRESYRCLCQESLQVYLGWHWSQREFSGTASELMPMHSMCCHTLQSIKKTTITLHPLSKWWVKNNVYNARRVFFELMTKETA